MDDKFNIGDIKSSGSNISGNKNFLFPFSKFFQIVLSCRLRNISMKNNYILVVEISDEIVGLNFGLSKDDGPFLRIVSFD